MKICHMMFEQTEALRFNEEQKLRCESEWLYSIYSSSSPTRFSSQLPEKGVADSGPTGFKPSSSAVGTRWVGGITGGAEESSDVEKTTRATKVVIIAEKRGSAGSRSDEGC